MKFTFGVLPQLDDESMRMPLGAVLRLTPGMPCRTFQT
jgi:hypothetical protein